MAVSTRINLSFIEALAIAFPLTGVAHITHSNWQVKTVKFIGFCVFCDWLVNWRCMRILTAFILLFTLVGLGASGIYLVGLHHFRAAQDAWDRQALEKAQAEVEQCLRVWPWSYRAH